MAPTEQGDSNASTGMTPFDYAPQIIHQYPCDTKNWRISHTILRRLEEAAPFAGWLDVKETKWEGLRSAWVPRWVTVVHRIPGPAAPPSERVVRVVLSYYRAHERLKPFLQVHP